MIAPITPEQVWTEDFFSLIGMGEMSSAEKEKILLKMNDTVMARVYLTIINNLSEEDNRSLEALNPDETAGFLKEKGFDLGKLVLDEALRYRLEVARMFQLATTPLTNSNSPA